MEIPHYEPQNTHQDTYDNLRNLKLIPNMFAQTHQTKSESFFFLDCLSHFFLHFFCASLELLLLGLTQK